MLKRSTVAALLLAAGQVALARNASAPWDTDSAKTKANGKSLKGDKNDDEAEMEQEWKRFAQFEKSIGYWGYSWEPYEVTTKDGFRLTLFRITGGPPEGFIKPEDSSSESEDKQDPISHSDNQDEQNTIQQKNHSGNPLLNLMQKDVEDAAENSNSDDFQQQAGGEEEQSDQEQKYDSDYDDTSSEYDEEQETSSSGDENEERSSHTEWPAIDDEQAGLSPKYDNTKEEENQLDSESSDESESSYSSSSSSSYSSSSELSSSTSQYTSSSEETVYETCSSDESGCISFDTTDSEDEKMKPETESKESPLDQNEKDSKKPNQEGTPVDKPKKEPHFVKPDKSDSEHVSSENDEGDNDENEIDGEDRGSSDDSDSSDDDEWVTCGSDESGCQTFDSSDSEDAPELASEVLPADHSDQEKEQQSGDENSSSLEENEEQSSDQENEEELESFDDQAQDEDESFKTPFETQPEFQDEEYQEFGHEFDQFSDEDQDGDWEDQESYQSPSRHDKKHNKKPKRRHDHHRPLQPYDESLLQQDEEELFYGQNEHQKEEQRRQSRHKKQPHHHRPHRKSKDRQNENSEHFQDENQEDYNDQEGQWSEDSYSSVDESEEDLEERKFYEMNRQNNDILGESKNNVPDQSVQNEGDQQFKKPTLEEAYESEMDQRMVDANDPTSFGTDTVRTKEIDEHIDEIDQEEGIKIKDKEKDNNGGWGTTTVITEDFEWGNQGHGKPVLLQHGHHLDSEIWFQEKNVGKPIPLQLFDAGYDVWLGNNRGSYNCELGTGRQSQMNQREVWDWSYPEMAKYDLPAFILKIKSENEIDSQVAYIGYDQGATQMLYGLAHWENQFFKRHVSKVILMAPCAKPKVMDYEKIFDGYKNVFQTTQNGMIHSSLDPRWQGKMRRLVCHKISVEYCMTYYDDYQATSMKALEHMLQNGVEQRFQEYAPEYIKNNTHRIATDVPISSISEVPVYIYVAGDDLFCPKEQAFWTADQIGDAVQEVRVFDEQDHSYFTYSLDLVLMESLLHALSKQENPRKTLFHHNWEAWEENNIIGFAPHFKSNKPSNKKSTGSSDLFNFNQN